MDKIGLVITSLMLALLFGANDTRQHNRNRRSLCRYQTGVRVVEIKDFYQRILPELDGYVQSAMSFLIPRLNGQHYGTRQNNESLRLYITEQSGLVQQIGKRLKHHLSQIFIKYAQLGHLRSDLIISSSNPLINFTNTLINVLCPAISYAGVTPPLHIGTVQPIDEGTFYLEYLDIMLDLSDFIQFISEIDTINVIVRNNVTIVEKL